MGQKGGRGRVGPKNEKLPVQRAIYLGTHSMPGRSVLGFVQGSRVVAGVTFMKKFPEVQSWTYCTITSTADV